jgi:hypothetical protein
MMKSKGGEFADKRSSPGDPIMDMHEFDKNRLAFPPEELLLYRGIASAKH